MSFIASSIFIQDAKEYIFKVLIEFDNDSFNKCMLYLANMCNEICTL